MCEVRGKCVKITRESIYIDEDNEDDISIYSMINIPASIILKLSRIVGKRIEYNENDKNITINYYDSLLNEEDYSMSIKQCIKIEKNKKEKSEIIYDSNGKYRLSLKSVKNFKEALDNLNKN